MDLLNVRIAPSARPTTGLGRLLSPIGAPAKPPQDPWQVAPYAIREAAEVPFAPVRGVSLEMFADIAKAIASRDDIRAHGRDLALDMGIEPNDWQLACRTWNDRVASNPAVARQFMMRFRDEVPSYI